MAITMKTPNVIHLGGDVTLVNHLPASEAITPGHLVEYVADSSVLKIRKHATSGGAATAMFALDQSEFNKGVDDAYAAGDVVKGGIMHKGATVWALIASGQNIAVADKLESAGDGTLKILASGVAVAQALEAKNATALTRIRVEAL